VIGARWSRDWSGNIGLNGCCIALWSHVFVNAGFASFLVIACGRECCFRPWSNTRIQIKVYTINTPMCVVVRCLETFLLVFWTCLPFQHLLNTKTDVPPDHTCAHFGPSFVFTSWSEYARFFVLERNTLMTLRWVCLLVSSNL